MPSWGHLEKILNQPNEKPMSAKLSEEQIKAIDQYLADRKKTGDTDEGIFLRIIKRLKADREAMKAELAEAQEELKLWKPMTNEEAEAAVAAAVGIPISDEEIGRIVAKVTDPAYRPTEPECVLMAAKIEQLQAELATAQAALREANRDAERYRWLRSDGLQHIDFTNLTPDTCDVGLDHAIDAAHRSQQASRIFDAITNKSAGEGEG